MFTPGAERHFARFVEINFLTIKSKKMINNIESKLLPLPDGHLEMFYKCKECHGWDMDVMADGLCTACYYCSFDKEEVQQEIDPFTEIAYNDLMAENAEWLENHPRPGEDYMKCGCGRTDWCNKDTCG